VSAKLFPQVHQDKHFANDQVTEPEFVSQQVTVARRFYLNLAPKKQTKLAVVCGGVERCHPEYVVQRTSFPYYGLEFVAEGKGFLEISGKSYSLRPGVAFLYREKTPHLIRTDPTAPMLKYYVDFAGRLAESVLSKTKFAKEEVLQTSNHQTIQTTLELLLETGLNMTASSHSTALHFLHILVEKISDSAVPLNDLDFPAFPAYQKVRGYIEERYLQLTSLEEVAQACHLDPAYICRLFQRFADETAYQLLTRLKMNHAADLLLQTRGVKQVAEEMNFADQFHFSKVFKKVYGISPSRFIGERSA
jgi:AraC-like DNA-binding protein